MPSCFAVRFVCLGSWVLDSWVLDCVFSGFVFLCFGCFWVLVFGFVLWNCCLLLWICWTLFVRFVGVYVGSWGTSLIYIYIYIYPLSSLLLSPFPLLWGFGFWVLGFGFGSLGSWILGVWVMVLGFGVLGL